MSSTKKTVVIMAVDPEKLRPSQLKALGLPIHGRGMRPKPMPVQGWFPSTHSSGGFNSLQQNAGNMNFKQLKSAVSQLDKEQKALKAVKNSGETTCWLSVANPDFHWSQGCSGCSGPGGQICTIQDAQRQGRKPCLDCWL